MSRGSFARVPPVAGFSTVSMPPSCACTHAPLMKSRGSRRRNAAVSADGLPERSMAMRTAPRWLGGLPW